MISFIIYYLLNALYGIKIEIIKLPLSHTIYFVLVTRVRLKSEYLFFPSFPFLIGQLDEMENSITVCPLPRNPNFLISEILRQFK